MDELVFLKLGGSLLTDKTQAETVRAAVLGRLAGEIAVALASAPGLRLLIGHGSGSFGHVAARRHNTRAGVNSREGWRSYAETARAAARLNRLVVEALQAAHVPVLPLQPSASALCYDGELRELAERPLRVGLANGLVPLIYGDVALDEVRGGTIVSTEELFRWLAPRLAPIRVLLLGEVAGVMPYDPAKPPLEVLASPAEAAPYVEITPRMLPALADALGSSRGVDVTGGMLSKVLQMLDLVQNVPSLSHVHILSGLTPGVLQTVLIDGAVPTGTRIRAR
jgi:isopentenyl phosphate kinase